MVTAKNIRGKNDRAYERKRQIARSAAALFVKKGYLGTTVREIAQGCGMSVGTLYYYIRSKSDILSLFQEFTSSLVNRFIQQKLPAWRRISPREALCQSIETYLFFTNDIQDIIVFWYQDSRHLSASQLERLLRHEQYTVSMFKEILTWGYEIGEFKSCNIELTAHYIVVLCDMWAFRRWFLKGHCTLEQYTKDVVEFILNGISGG